MKSMEKEERRKKKGSRERGREEKRARGDEEKMKKGKGKRGKERATIISSRANTA